MALEVFTGSSMIPREFATAAMEYLWSKWRVLSATNSLTLQRLIEETSYQLRTNLTQLISCGDDFIYIYVGEAVEREIGENLAGTALSQSGNALAGEFTEVYRRVIASQRPAFIRYTNARSQIGTIWQRLILPIRMANDQVMLVLYSEVVSHRLEIYEHLFKTAPDAMVIAYPIANDVGHTTDGWVVMMNDRARELLSFTGPIHNLQLSQLPQFRDIGIWGRLYAPKGAPTPTPLETPDFDLELLRFPSAFGLRLKPKPFSLHSMPLVPSPALS
ncbi:MAG TPA: hypothetical protein VNZ94_14955 [Xanthobacteraceae bacterium]|nr:hypothetical protein [Xanthobacteraceae bacterium]